MELFKLDESASAAASSRDLARHARAAHDECNDALAILLEAAAYALDRKPTSKASVAQHAECLADIHHALAVAVSIIRAGRAERDADAAQRALDGVA